MAGICNSVATYSLLALRHISKPFQEAWQQGNAASHCLQVPWQQIQVRGRYANWQMLRDVKRRACVKEHATERLRINALRRNTILPPVIREMATKEIEKFPIDSNRTRLVNRCVMTSRPRNVRKHWRISRIMWRHLADYNKLSGITRSSW